ncbi:MAG: alpha-N-arabinofuranosidase [Candidatus Atribacteria bacterium]|nr:alpha-N-arabinofuranosidase [Candidatus Atribacteria bacterium]
MDAYCKVWGVKTGEIHSLIYGHFIEHLGRCVYGGIFDPGSPLADARGFRRDVLEAVKKIKCPVLRWPGGNFASAYHWENGVGPVEKRPQLINYVWGGLESNHFGTDEFIEYCRALGTEPYLTVSLGTATLDEALNWLEYCNLDTPTRYALLRKQYGHPEPYRVKYWGIGNEVYGPWQVGHCSASEYAEKLRQYAMFMKAVDPSIKVIAVGADNPEWDLTVLKHAGKLIDYISIHQYHGSPDYYETVAAAYYVEERLQLLAHLIRSVNLPQVKIAFDEWNVWYQVSAEKEGEEKRIVLLEEPYALKDALFAAGIFCILHRMSDVVGMANLAQMVNALGMIKTTPQKMVLTPLYDVFDLFVNHTGRVRLGLEMTTDYYAIKAKSFVDGRFHFELDRVPYFDASATYDPEKKTVSLALVNFYRDEKLELAVDLRDIAVEREARLFTLSHQDVLALNDFENPDSVRARETSLSLEGPSFALTLPPHSLSVLEIPVTKVW